MSEGILRHIRRSTDPSASPSGYVDLYNKDGAYYAIDENGVIFTFADENLNSLRGVVGVTADGANNTISTGIKGYIEMPYSGTIQSVTLTADQTGDIVFDIWKDTYANYPPTAADSICGAAKPTISSSNKSQDVTLTGWTTSLSVGDILAFNVDSASTITRCTLTLKVAKSA